MAAADIAEDHSAGGLVQVEERDEVRFDAGVAGVTPDGSDADGVGVVVLEFDNEAVTTVEHREVGEVGAHGRRMRHSSMARHCATLPASALLLRSRVGTAEGIRRGYDIIIA